MIFKLCLGDYHTCQYKIDIGKNMIKITDVIIKAMIELIKSYLNFGRANNWFTSLTLARKLNEP